MCYVICLYMAGYYAEFIYFKRFATLFTPDIKLADDAGVLVRIGVSVLWDLIIFFPYFQVFL